MGSTFVIGGADRFEAQAESNEARILAAASEGWVGGGRDGLFQRTSDRFAPDHLGTSISRLQRRPIGGAVGGALLQASLGAVFSRQGRGGVTGEGGAGAATLSIGSLVVRWPEAGPIGQRPSVSPALEHVRAPDRRASAAPPGFAQATQRSAGQPLPGTVRAKMEQAFGGADLSSVRVHTGPDARALTSSIHARAFATGGHVFFNQGQFDPHSPRGLALIGHELTHVLQQRAGASPLPGAPPAQAAPMPRALVSPLGRGGLLEAAGSRQVERLSAPDAQVRRKASAMVRRAASAASGSTLRRSPSSAPAGAAGSSGAMAGAAAGAAAGAMAGATAGATAQGRVVIESLTVTVTGAAAPGASPSMVTVAGKGADSGQAPGGFGALLSRSAGTPLPQRLNEQLGALLGADFGDVRVHTGEAAARAASTINAEAFAIGRDVYFGAGRWDPTSPRGVALIGHELTHVAQARGGARSVSPRAAGAVRRRQPGPFTAASRYWASAGDSGAAQGGVWGNAKAGGAALMQGLADPGGMGSDAEAFQAALVQAMIRHGGPLTFDDPQRKSWDEVQEFFDRTGDAAFNRAPPSGDFPGGAMATRQLTEWLKRRTEAGTITLDELIHQAIVSNTGNVTLAMGSLAEILCRGEHRALAGAKVQGLRGHKKDYYIFAGAFVGFQPSAVQRQLGKAGSLANIAGNPLLYGAVGAYDWLVGGWTGDVQRHEAGGRLALSRMGPRDNWNKVREFGIGYDVAAGLSGRVLKKEAFEVAGHDSFEQQALANERAILQAMQGGPSPSSAGAPGPGPGRRPGYVALRASARSARLSRRAGLISRKGRWERFKAAVSEELDSNREYWDEVGVAGIQRGGVLGHSQAMVAALFSGINQPELARAYVEGLASGAVTGAKGVVNMVVHPIETAEGMYRLVVHFDETKAGLKALVAEYVEACHSDPVKFARMTGELTGQIEVALIGPKVIGGPKEVLGAVRTARNVLPKGRTLWYYTDDVGAAAVAPGGVGRAGQIGRAGATEVFATPLDPLLGGSRSLMGMFARNVFLGGRLDFVRKAGQLLPQMRIKAAFTQAVGFKGGSFRHIFFTEVETALARAAKGVFPQYAAGGPQQVQVVAQAVLSRQETLHALLDGAGMLGTGSNIVINNTEVPFKDLIESTLEFYGLEAALKKERTPTERYLGDSPGERLRRGGRLGRALDLLDEPGLPLEHAVRSRLEQALGADLGDVRVHTGEAAEHLAREIGAEAFTIGNTIFMGEGAWRPETVEGLGTLVHEATHVMQDAQGRLAGPATPTRTQALEAEAYAHERAFVRGPAAGPSRAIGGLAGGPLGGGAAAPSRAEPPPMVVREAPPAQDDLPAPESAPVPTLAMRKAASQEIDPIQRVMDTWSVSEMSREEFLESCTERVLELMREEVEVDAERGATNLAWSYDAPLS